MNGLNNAGPALDLLDLHAGASRSLQAGASALSALSTSYIVADSIFPDHTAFAQAVAIAVSVSSAVLTPSLRSWLEEPEAGDACVQFAKLMSSACAGSVLVAASLALTGSSVAANALTASFASGLGAACAATVMTHYTDQAAEIAADAAHGLVDRAVNWYRGDAIAALQEQIEQAVQQRPGPQHEPAPEPLDLEGARFHEGASS